MDKYLEAEVAFHDEIIKAARSTVLQSIMESLRDLLLEGRTKITSHETGKNNLDFHVRIFEASKAQSGTGQEEDGRPFAGQSKTVRGVLSKPQDFDDLTSEAPPYSRQAFPEELTKSMAG